MGITIHYRGTVDDLAQVEVLEDRITDLVFALGGRATVWRSYADHDPSRIVRGLMIEMAPGQETFSVLISPEGHLTPLFQIEDAEKTPFDEPPYCFVKTQLGSTAGHIALVHLLDALKQGYCSNLEVSDEGEYYEDRDVGKLTEKMRFLAGAIDSLADGLREHGLSDEAAEDPNIVASRIERIAKLVHQKMLGEAATEDEDSEASHFETDDAEWHEPSLEEEVDAMDALRRKNDLRSERMARRIAEAMALGMTAEEAFDLAMREEGLGVPPGDERSAESDSEAFDVEVQEEEPWLASLPSNPFDEASEIERREKHPAVVQAQRFLMDLMEFQKDASSPSPFVSIACRGAMDIVGGLVQATCDTVDTRSARAHAITQLKRALTGHAFARGAIFGMRSADAISEETSSQLHEQLVEILKTIHQLAEKAWDEEM